MNWILAFVAFLVYAGSRTIDLTPTQQVHLYLTKLVEVEQGFFWVALLLLAVGIVSAILIGRKDAESGIGCGCSFAIAAGIVFIGTGIGYLLTQGMLSGFDPMLGVVDPIKFYACLLIFILTGVS